MCEVQMNLKMRMEKWLPDMDLNHDKQIQSLLCYRYTIGQDGMHSLNILKNESRNVDWLND